MEELTDTQLRAEEKRIELEERRQALESKKISDDLSRIMLAEKRQELDTKINNKKRGAMESAKAIADMKASQARCNHHVGGEGGIAIAMGQGDMERPTAVSGIQFTDGTTMLRCNRCRKPWRSNLPNGDAYHGPWVEGVRLFQKTQFKTIAVVGGIVVKKEEVTLTV